MAGSYKIVRITEVKRADCFTEFLELYPHYYEKTYEELQTAWFDQAYNYSDSLAWGMRSLGHVAEEIVYDCEILQKTWAKEHDIFFEEKNWQLAICLAQLHALKPDIIYLQDIHTLPHDVIKQLKSLVPSLKQLIIFRGHPECDEALARLLSYADLLLVGSPVLLKKCRFFGLNPHLVYHFFDQRILNKIVKSEQKYPFTFTGSSGLGYGMSHASRYWLLSQLLKKSSLELWIDEPDEYEPDVLVHQFKYSVKKGLLRILGQFSPKSLNKMKNYKTPLSHLNKCIYSAWEMKEEGYPLFIPSIPLKDLYPERCHAPLFGINMYDQLAKSKISFNKHSNCAQKIADNIRLFQATGVGSCLLTDACENMRALFEPDREIVEYSSQEECLEKVAYLLNHDDVRRQICIKGQERTLRDHTVTNRCHHINELIQKSMG